MNCKRPLAFISAGLIAGALSTPVWAQGAPSAILSTPTNTRYGEHHAKAEEFGDYLDSHPDEAKELRKNPHLADNPPYLAAHPDLQNYLNSHPGAKERLEHHPDRFVHREHRYEKSVKRYDKKHHIEQ